MGDPPSIAGRVLADKYLLIERLGEGGFGSIWRGEHQILRSPIAVKLIDLGIASREGAVERFLREAQATAALRSPHVVQVLDYGLDHRDQDGEAIEQPFIVMELLEGENLAQRLERVGKLEPLETVRIVTHVARAISKAHEVGIIHRDLKPENIFLVNNGDEEIAKVLDFGVAKIASPNMDLDTYTQTGSMVGTPYYMSPEQAQGNKTVDYRSDLWAMGVITFEMLTGVRPFDSEALGDLVLRICVRDIPVPSDFGPVPEGFDAWFARALARDPDARFQSAREQALALLAVVEAGGEAGGEASARLTHFDERSVRPVTARSDALPDAAIPEIPSRPHQSAFAATIRDDGLAADALESRPGHPAVSPSAEPTGLAEPLGPWALVGMGLVALAAGAAAVYGLFYLLRYPATAPEPSLVIPSASQSLVRSTVPVRPQPKALRGTSVHRPHAKPGAEPRGGAPVALDPEPETAGVPSGAPPHTEPPLPSAVPSQNAAPPPEGQAISPVPPSTTPASLLAPEPESSARSRDTMPPEQQSIPVAPPEPLGEPSAAPEHPIDSLPLVTDR